MAPRKPSDVGAPRDTGPPPRDLHPTSDIRFVIVQVAKLEERIGLLIDESGAHKRDFRWTWGGLVVGFLILAGFFITGYNRLEDKMAGIETRIDSALTAVNQGQVTTARIETKMDDLQNRILPTRH